MADAIKIIGRPMGEAPEWVRDAWIGLTLPVVRQARPRTARGVGVVKGPRTLWRSIWASIDPTLPRFTGYFVKVVAAVSILEGPSPDAAAWWRVNAPHLLNRWGVFIFDEDCAIPADDD